MRDHVANLKDISAWPTMRPGKTLQVRPHSEYCYSIMLLDRYSTDQFHEAIESTSHLPT